MTFATLATKEAIGAAKRAKSRTHGRCWVEDNVSDCSGIILKSYRLYALCSSSKVGWHQGSANGRANGRGAGQVQIDMVRMAANGRAQ